MPVVPDAKQGFQEALAAQQEVPLTMNDPITQRIAAAMTSLNTGSGQPQLTGPATTESNPPPRILSNNEVRQWIFDHMKNIKVAGNITTAETDLLLDEDDMLFRRLNMMFGGNLFFVKSEDAQFSLGSMGYTDDLWSRLNEEADRDRTGPDATRGDGTAQQAQDAVDANIDPAEEERKRIEEQERVTREREREKSVKEEEDRVKAEGERQQREAQGDQTNKNKNKGNK